MILHRLMLNIHDSERLRHHFRTLKETIANIEDKVPRTNREIFGVEVSVTPDYASRRPSLDEWTLSEQSPFRMTKLFIRDFPVLQVSLLLSIILSRRLQI